MTASGLPVVLRNNDTGKTFSAFVKDHDLKNKQVAVYPTKDDYSDFTVNPFICLLPPNRQSAGDLQVGDVLEELF